MAAQTIDYGNTHTGMSDPALRRLAADLVDGKVFTTAHWSPDDIKQNLGLVFVPLALMPDVDRYLSDAGMVYEYRDRASVLSINGMPMFMSVRKVTLSDMPALNRYVKGYSELQAGFTGSAPIEIIPLAKQ